MPAAQVGGAQDAMAGSRGNDGRLAPPAAGGLRFDDSPCPPVASYFSSPRDPYLTALRRRYRLDRVVAGHHGDLQRVRVLSRWVRGRWDHDGWNAATRSDPMSILREAAAGSRFRCVEYSIVLAGVLNAMGVPARVLGLMVADVETRESGAAHVVTEAYLPDRRIWVMIDGQYDAIPLVDGQPVSAVDFSRALSHHSGGVGLESCLLTSSQRHRYLQRVRPYLHYFCVFTDQTYRKQRHPQTLRLGPLHSLEPRVFQRQHPISRAVYTHAPSMIYPEPIVLDGSPATRPWSRATKNSIAADRRAHV